ncbi:glutamate racemase [Solimicrobium silvestre]|nr:glutamate racemase [Solimicrobium silvestre]
MSNQAPIGIFDSGIGGLSVLRHICEQLPNESLCYFADSSFAPYGDKTEAEVIQRSLYVAQHLLQLGVKAIVVACNTATTAAIAALRANYPDLILVGVEPGLKPAASLSKTGHVGVLATSRTLASSKYQLLCEQIQQTTQVRFINQACPGLVDLIEQGELDSPAALELLNNYLQPIFQAQADTIVLGCTHYPFVETSIRQIANKTSPHPIQIIDTGLAIAKQLQRLLTQQQLLNQHKTAETLHCITNGAAEKLEFALSHLLKYQPEQYIIQEISCNFPAS